MSENHVILGKPAERSTLLAWPQAHRRFFLTGILLLVAIVSAAGAVIWMQRDNTIAAYRTATSNLGNGMAQQTSQAINSVDRVIRELATDLTSEADATSEQIAMAMRTQASSNLMGSLRKGAIYLNGLAVVEAGGVVQNSSASGISKGLDVSKMDFFGHFSVDDDHGAFVSAPTRSDLSAKWTVFISRRMNDGRGEFAGVVVAEISLASIEEFYKGAMPAYRSVSLARRDGTILARFPRREDEIGRKIPDGSPWYAAVAQGGGAYRANDYFLQTPVIAFARPLKDLPLVVQASVTEDDALADFPRQAVWIALVAVAAIIGLILLLRHLARQIHLLERSGALLVSKNFEIETAHRQLDVALANISLGVCFFSGDRKLILSNKKYSEIYNLPPEATRPGTTLVKLMDYLFAAGHFPRIGRAEYVLFREGMVESGKRQQAAVELMSGQTVFVTHQPMPNGGWISTHEDITARCEADRHIRFLAHHDMLTGLSNRAFFAEKLDEAIVRLQRHGISFTLFMMDLDRFKNVNDTRGHPAGDQLLVETAQRLRSALHDNDVLARLGGDEFAILTSGEKSTQEAAATLATRILKIIPEPFDIDGKAVFVGVSIGIACAPESCSTSSDVLKMADLALYAVKASGRNDFRFFGTEMLSAMNSRRGGEDERRAAPRRDISAVLGL